MARSNDDEFAEQVLAAHPEDEQSSAPPLELFSPEVAALTNVTDLLGVALARLEQLVTGKPPSHKPQPSLRPVTAFDRVRHRRSWQAHADLVDEVEVARRRRLSADDA